MTDDTDPDPLSLIDWLQIQQALRWVETAIGVEKSTLSIRVAYRIETLLEKELT